MTDLGELVTGSYDRAYRTACLIVGNPADAEEAVQEAFLRAWRFRAAVRDDQEMEPWLYRVLVNACYSKLRTAARTRAETALLTDGRGEEPDPADAAIGAEVASAMRAALWALPESLRVPVVLRYFSGLSEKEVAAAIRRRPGTVKSRLHEARRRLAADPGLQNLASQVGA